MVLILTKDMGANNNWRKKVWRGVMVIQWHLQLLRLSDVSGRWKKYAYGVLVAWYWWGKIGGKPFPVLACSPQISLGLGLDWTQASTLRYWGLVTSVTWWQSECTTAHICLSYFSGYISSMTRCVFIRVKVIQKYVEKNETCILCQPDFSASHIFF